MTNRRRGGLRAAGLLLLVVAMFGTAARADHVPVVDISLGFPAQENFNDDNGGYSSFKPATQLQAPNNPSWAHGTPTSGPGVAFSGTNVWATNLAGNYNASECSALLSPPIDLTGATSASVSFMQWRHMEESTLATSFAFDGGMLFVTPDAGASLTQVTPAGGYTSKQLGSTVRTCFRGQPTGAKGLSGPAGTTPPAAVYTPVTTDLSAFAGQTVRFVIAFGSDSITQRAGWYIDDFAVTINGSTTTENFESGNGGFSIINTKTPIVPLGWSHGVPTSGPAGSADLDAPLWGTNLAGSYGQGECSYIESAPIDLAPLGEDLGDLDDDLPLVRAILSWKQWYRSSSSSAAGVLQVGLNGTYTNVKPTTGYPSAGPTGTSGTELDACLGHLAQGTGSFTGALQPVGASMVDFSADLTNWVGKTITLRYLFASTKTAFISTTDHGWYVDDVAVEIRATAYEPHTPPPPSGVPFTPVQNLYSQNFEANDGGYTVSGNALWQHGAPVSPPQALNGVNVWGTNLAGSYTANNCGSLTSSAIDLTAVPAGAPAEAGSLARLTFKHWKQIESGYDGGVVQASTDGGVTWTRLTPLGGYDRTLTSALAAGTRACLGVTTTDPVYSGPSTAPAADAWQAAQFDFTPFLGKVVQIRFVFGSDSSVHYRGWYVDDVSIDLGAGVTLPAPPPPPAAAI